MTRTYAPSEGTASRSTVRLTFGDSRALRPFAAYFSPVDVEHRCDPTSPSRPLVRHALVGEPLEVVLTTTLHFERRRCKNKWPRWLAPERASFTGDLLAQLFEALDNPRLGLRPSSNPQARVRRAT